MDARGIRTGVLVFVAIIGAFLAGAWLGNKEQTCAAVPTQFGTALVCSSELKDYIVQ